MLATASDAPAAGSVIGVEPLPCFAHGQLVVALTRVGNPDRVHIYLHHSDFATRSTNSVLLTEVLLSPRDGLVEVGNTTVAADESAHDDNQTEHSTQQPTGHIQWDRVVAWVTRVMEETTGGAADLSDADSADLEVIAQRIEEGTAICVAPDELHQLHTVDAIADYIMRHCDAQLPLGISVLPGLRCFYAFNEEEPDDLEQAELSFEPDPIAVEAVNAWCDVEAHNEVPAGGVYDVADAMLNILPADDDPDLQLYMEETNDALEMELMDVEIDEALLADTDTAMMHSE